ncbi:MULTISPECIES: hypothetical protein [Methylocystis]|uniref:Uncharacterized protein n=1 Tax=Methylocystis iwaonis TaxID=2885079 RepID=A0ABM8E466_9HYPH|nr:MULTISPECIES: hypothetical protein [Methylocystis]MBL1255474.1 hypothetical protein [Methylocystis sp. Sn-Cys]MDJ0449764.1 hypothetical protein [Methylocystis sp. JR02]BDV32692.1 hypothetical protein SS37A_02210 [Methylocystis iwaonis]
MSVKLLFAAAALGVVLSAAPACASDRFFDFDEVWDQSMQKHRRDEVLSVTPRDATRHQSPYVFRGRPHDPTGNITLEGAR